MTDIRPYPVCDFEDCRRQDKTVEPHPDFSTPFNMCDPCRERYEQRPLGEAS